jgi:tetratricopeptide (TPR) repeat protein
LASVAFAQEEMRVIDSLERVMAKQEGRERVETMMELSKAFVDFSFDDCINWGEKAIKEAASLQDDELVAKAYWKIGLRYLHHYEFDLAHDQFVTAWDILRDKQKASEQLMDVLNYKGYVELYMGEIDSALTTYQQTLKVSEILGDEANCADVYNGMAYLHFQQGRFDKAMECFLNARNRYEHLQDTLSVAQCDNNISNIYVEWQKFDEALALLQKVIPVFERNEDEASLAHAYQNLGAIYATGHVNMDSALVYLNKSIVCAKNVGDQVTLIEDELELAGVLRHLGREKDAIGLYQSALHSSETMGYVIGMLEAYKNLGIHYNETGDFTTSAIYLKRCMDLASEKGNQLYVNTVRPYLIADYARLGQLMEMKRELGLIQDDYMGIVNENSALSDELSRIQYNVEGLLGQYESQINQIETLQSQRNHYRMAFYGLLCLCLAAVVLYIAYKIVRKKRSKV